MARLVALTFDDGPGRGTPALLDLLADHGAQATFFVLGDSIVGREDVLRRTVGDGHEVGNHTWSHRRAHALADAELEDELARTAAEIERVAGVRPVLLRPPYGDAPERFRALGETVMWTVDPEDWREPPAGEIVRRVLEALAPGAIVLLHDGFIRARSTVDAVAQLLPALAERDYRCVTVSELLNRPPARRPAATSRRRSGS